MKATELKSKTVSELKTVLNGLRRQQFKLRIVKSSGELTGTHEIKALRRNIARVETILTEKKGDLT